MSSATSTGHETPSRGRPAGGRARPRWLLPVLLILFLLSGTSALVYQVLWMRLLGVVFGVTVHAASTVLASFMSGLAAGSYLAGRLADRIQNPLAWFGLAELLVGGSALATPAALDLVKDAYGDIHDLLPESVALVTAIRFLLASSVLAVPTILMGATLPLVLKSSLVGQGGFGARASLLYGTNTAGAILGALATGFYLIPAVGLRGAFMLAAALNGLVGAAALVASLRMPRATDRREPGGPPGMTTADPEPDELPTATRRLVLIVFVVSGFATLALEVIWFRVLVLVLRATTYAFTIMLAAILAGIAAGSYLSAPILRRRRDWLAWLACLEIGIGLAALLSFVTLGWSFDVVPVVQPYLDSVLTGYVTPLVVASFLAIFPTALLMGIAFPIGLSLYAGGGRSAAPAGERIGRFYAWNVCGAILGALVTGFWLLAAAGSVRALLLVASSSVGAGLLLATHLRSQAKFWSIGAAGLASFTALALAVPSPFDLSFERLFGSERVLWREEGVQTTVSVHTRQIGRREHRIMYLDGSHQANDTDGTVFVHRRIGFLPAALHPDPKDALVVGLGGGATAGAVSRFPGIHVDVVELSDSVVRAAALFRHVNFDLARRPGVRLHVNDGRNFMLLTDRRYDIVTADIVLPRHAGAGNLYSTEYFSLVRQVLKEDGLAVQWVSPETDDEFKLVARTFLRVFPETTVWGDGSLLIGTKKPLRLSRSGFERKTAAPETREALELMGIPTFERLQSLYVAGPAELERFVGDGPVLTDDWPKTEYFLSLPPGAAPADLRGLSGDVSRVLNGE